MTDIHVNWTRYSETFCQLNYCWTCERDRRMLGQFRSGTEQDGHARDAAKCGLMARCIHVPLLQAGVSINESTRATSLRKSACLHEQTRKTNRTPAVPVCRI